MAKMFLWIHETRERINEFSIGYMINPKLHINKSLKEQVEKCVNNTFGTLTQPFIKKLPQKRIPMYYHEQCFMILDKQRQINLSEC